MAKTRRNLEPITEPMENSDFVQSGRRRKLIWCAVFSVLASMGLLIMLMPFGSAQFVPTFFGHPGTYVLVKKERLHYDTDSSFFPMINNHGPIMPNVLPMPMGLPSEFNLAIKSPNDDDNNNMRTRLPNRFNLNIISPDDVQRFRSVPTFIPI